MKILGIWFVLTSNFVIKKVDVIYYVYAVTLERNNSCILLL